MANTNDGGRNAAGLNDSNNTMGDNMVAPKTGSNEMRNRGADSLELLAYRVSQAITKLYPGRNQSELMRDKATRAECHDKFVQMLECDTDSSRASYRRQLAADAEEILARRSRQADEDPEKLSGVDLRSAVIGDLGLKEERYIKDAQYYENKRREQRVNRYAGAESPPRRESRQGGYNSPPPRPREGRRSEYTQGKAGYTARN